MTPATPWPAARSIAHGVGRSHPSPRESVPLGSAISRVLAEDLVALADLPSFDTSAMDGWAVRGEGPWALAGESLAGRPWTRRLDDARAVTIATGALVPGGATGILRREDGREREAAVIAERRPREGDIRRAGEECARGDVLARSGTAVTPTMAGLAAAAGQDAVQVASRPRVALLIFGDELTTGGIPTGGRVRDSLGPQLPSWIRGMGGSAPRTARAGDTLDAHVRAIGEAAASADLIVTTGGTAAGPVDHLHAALEALHGRVLVDGVAVRPGYPMLLAQVPADDGRGVPLVALPGNPMSAVVGATTLAWPLLAGMLGQPEPAVGRIRLASPLGARPREHRLVAGRRDDFGGFLPAGHLGSSMLRGLAESEGFAVVPPESEADGDDILWQPLPPFLPEGAEA